MVQNNRESGTLGVVNGGGTCKRRRNVGVKLKSQWRPSQSRKESILNCLLMGKMGFVHKSKGVVGSRNCGPLRRGYHKRRIKLNCKVKNIVARKGGILSMYYNYKDKIHLQSLLMNDFKVNTVLIQLI